MAIGLLTLATLGTLGLAVTILFGYRLPVAVSMKTHFMAALLSTTLPPIGAIILADYFLVNRGRYAAFDEAELPVVRWQALAAWVLGVVAAHLPGVPPLNGLLAAAFAHTILCRATLRGPVASPAAG